MSSDRNSTKRKRPNDEAPKDEATKEPAIIKSKYWIDDGNVIIQVENTLFRVHRSMLSRNSPVFKDMFDIPQPQDGLLDGCPVIHLSDKARDFEHLMSIFYDNARHYDLRIPMSFEHLAASLRLGKKYHIDYLLEEGLTRFRHEFPNEMSGWDALSVKNPGQEIADQTEFYASGIALANELSLKRSLPALCLFKIQRSTARDLFEYFENRVEVTKSMNIPPHLWKQCLEGRDIILCRIHQTFHAWACSPASSPIPDKKCSKIASCTSSRALAVMKISSDDPDSLSAIEIMRRTSLPAEINELLCKNCRASLKAAVEQFRVDLWRDLPSIFNIGKSWEDLKDFE